MTIEELIARIDRLKSEIEALRCNTKEVEGLSKRQYERAKEQEKKVDALVL